MVVSQVEIFLLNVCHPEQCQPEPVEGLSKACRRRFLSEMPLNKPGIKRYRPMMPMI